MAAVAPAAAAVTGAEDGAAALSKADSLGKLDDPVELGRNKRENYVQQVENVDSRRLLVLAGREGGGEGGVAAAAWVEEDEEEVRRRGCCGRCLAHKCTKGLLKFCFSNAGLSIIVLSYTIIGAFIFMAIERPDEVELRNATNNEAKAIEVPRPPFDGTARVQTIPQMEREALAQRIIQHALDNRGGNRTDVVVEFKKWLDAYHKRVAGAIQDVGYDGPSPPHSSVLGSDCDWTWKGRTTRTRTTTGTWPRRSSSRPPS